MKQMNIFGSETQLNKLTKLGDPLEKINEVIDWEIFREAIEKATRKENYAKGGRPPYDAIMMYKITMLEQWYGLADMAAEYQINDRVSFCRFLGLEFGDKVPDGNTIWDFKEALKENGTDRVLFDMFNTMLEEKGVITHTGTIVDATFVTVDKRHTTKKDDQSLKEGDCPHDLHEKCAKRLESGEIEDDENVFRQMDFDARWTKKNEEAFFGYKDHVKCDKDSKIITDFAVTDAAVHDSQEVVDLIDENDHVVDLDAGYVGDYADLIREKVPGIEVNVCKRAYRKKPLSEEDKAENKAISRRRSRIEHIFGYMTRFMDGLTSRVHGFERIKRDITAKNLAYNLKRFVFLASAKKQVAVA
jgi:IS5 family transposase